MPLPSTLHNQFPRELRTWSSSERPSQTPEPSVALQPPLPVFPSGGQSIPSTQQSPLPVFPSGGQSVPSTQPEAALPTALGIPKPPGEVCRGADRGYNLQDTLEWDATLYAEVRVSCLLTIALVSQLTALDSQGFIKALAGVHLHPGVCLSKQSKTQVRIVCEQVKIHSSVALTSMH
jgi:hypothetical protein